MGQTNCLWPATMACHPQSTGSITTVTENFNLLRPTEGTVVKFRCERDVFVDALTTVGRAVAGRSGALPVLSGIRLEVSGDHLALTGTDLDLTIQAELTVAGATDGVVVAPGRLITDIVRALEPGAVTLEADEEELQITAGRSQFSCTPIWLVTSRP